MRKLFIAVLCLPLLSVFVSCQASKEASVTQFVDPYIGTDYHGHVFLGANVPFGGVQLGPSNITQGWDWCSGYHYSDSTIIGFAHTHLSGTGIGDLGDIVFMPVTGDVPLVKGKNPSDGYMSSFSHKNEIAKAGYYAVKLDKYDIYAELTTTTRVGFHRYTFPATDKDNKVIIDLESGIGWDAPVEGYIKQTGDKSIEGYRFSKGWAADQKIYFAAEFSQPIEAVVLYDTTAVLNGNEGKAKSLKAFVSFGNGVGKEIELVSKVGISAVDIEGAKANLSKEIPNWDFDEKVKAADKAWGDVLDKIKVKGGDSVQVRSFYTALYHSMFFPATFNDVNGNYRGADGKIYNDAGNIYTVYSLWDTYRAAHPLYTILDTTKVGEFVNNFIKIYEQQGKVPVWHLVGNETDCMVGYHSIPVIADAYLKGIGGFDPEKAYEAAKAYATLNERGLDYIREIGYIPAEKEYESVAKALEYCIDDWAIAQMAKRMGKEDDYNYFLARSKNYAHYFDKNINFMRGKRLDGKWNEPFNPSSSNHRADDYCEGNAWQYTWLVPHDVEGLVELFGSEEAFVSKLDSLFTVPFELSENTSVDISGLIGQYAQGNEPNHSTIFLYSYVGQQWKTADLSRKVMSMFFTDKPDGLCGNEDCGQMSAWYVFASMGFYPSNASNGAFLLASPVFDEVEIKLGEGKTFKLAANNNSADNKYIQNATLNGVPYTKSFITYKDIMNGGELVLTMGDTPNKEFGKNPEDRPKSIVY